jgi:hypothetical protein
MARATGLEPAASGVTGRGNSCVSRLHGYFPSALTSAKRRKSIRRYATISEGFGGPSDGSGEQLQDHAPLEANFLRHRPGREPYLAGAAGVHSHSTKENRPAFAKDRPVSVSVASVASVKRLVSPTGQTQQGNGRTTLPDTANAQLMARGQFLAFQELGDAKSTQE